MRNGRRGAPLRCVALLFVALLPAGCATLDSGSQETALPVVPPSAPRTIGLETPQAAEHKRLVGMFGGEYKAPAAERYLNGVLVRLAAASDKPSDPYRITILNSPVVNAFALPSGDLYVTRGLLELANDTSEVAAVMAHEIGHITAGHASQRTEQERRQALIAKTSTALQSKERSGQVQARNLASYANFSRQQEIEADRIGVRTTAKAGLDPFGASRFLVSLGRSVSLRASVFGGRDAEKPNLMASHPSTPERIQHALAEARQVGGPGLGDAARAPYLAVIDGMEFGDDPSEGVVRGHRFIHPRLGFGFAAPDGFTLENTAQAVLGIAAGGAEALRLDSVRVSADTALEAYLDSGWIEGLNKASISALTVNGLPAAIATAQSGEWNFRVAVFRLGSDVYRMIFAAHTLNAETDRRYRSSIDSFRRLAGDEGGKVRPLRIALLTASVSDTAETMAARMAVPERPLENFLVLNGLEKAGPLKGGERYKIVVE